jgi:signal transducing adaptor molecule
MPLPSATELAKEAEREAAVFAQAKNLEKLLNMLRALDPAKDNLADDEEIQVGTIISGFSYYFCVDNAWSLGALSILYGSSAQGCKFIDKKQPEKGCDTSNVPVSKFFWLVHFTAVLVSMNETFLRAQTIYDRMMEEILAKHAGSTCSVNFTSRLPSIKFLLYV